MSGGTKKERTHVVWFRRDLRVDDHRPLKAASDGGYPTVGVYLLNPREWTAQGEPTGALGAARARFIVEGLADLRSQLRSLGTELLVRRGHPEEVLLNLASELSVSEIHCADDPDPESRAVTERLIRLCRRHQIAPCVVEHGSLIHPYDLPFDDADWPNSFTNFRRRVEAVWRVDEPIPAPDRIQVPARVPDAGDLPREAAPGAWGIDDPRSGAWPGGETAGLNRWQQWAWERRGLSRYRETRDAVMGEWSSSRLSAYLSQGMISPRRVYESVWQYEQLYGADQGTYWLVFELLWRDYFRGWARRAGASLYDAGGVQGLPIPWMRRDRVFEAWCRGKTGFPLVDAAMRELRATGWTSNRCRQIAASFLTKVLGEDWRRGAEWFQHHLVDEDPCSNWGNWQYAAGVGADPQGFRIFDVVGQARRHDPDGTYLRRWIPELESAPTPTVHQPHPGHRRLGYPDPIVDWDTQLAEQREVFRAATRAGASEAATEPPKVEGAGEATPSPDSVRRRTAKEDPPLGPWTIQPLDLP